MLQTDTISKKESIAQAKFFARQANGGIICGQPDKGVFLCQKGGNVAGRREMGYAFHHRQCP
jgi:hypothetical protein